jgi:hypothetical protein
MVDFVMTAAIGHKILKMKIVGSSGEENDRLWRETVW